MIKAGGTDITITSTPDAVIDGNGQAWWDGQGSNGGWFTRSELAVGNLADC